MGQPGQAGACMDCTARSWQELSFLQATSSSELSGLKLELQYTTMGRLSTALLL